jgi:predicted 3-demethylubiquinone-9 3-methyltransferase (glyoxalase superfamily)
MCDRYGVSWQLMETNPAGEPRPFLTPSLLFGHVAQGRARAAIDFYTDLFDGSVGTLATYPADAGAQAGQVMFADYRLLGQWFAAMDSAGHEFTFTPGLSFVLYCADQSELDFYWERLSTQPSAEQSGWCVDPFGVSWQIVPTNLAALMAQPEAYQAIMGMKKIDLSALAGAGSGRLAG